MKSFRLALPVLIILGLSVSCNNEIDLYPDDAPKILYVLGCLDGTGTVQQVKVRKMISGDSEATDIANDPDYYLPDNPLRVCLEDPSGRQIDLHPVCYPPQNGGPFHQDSNLIYELRGFVPSSGKIYTLKIEDSTKGETISSQIHAMGGVGFTYPDKRFVNQVLYDFTDTSNLFRIKYTLSPINLWTVTLKYVDFLKSGEKICRKATFSSALQKGNVNTEPERIFTLEYVFNIFNRLIKDSSDVDYRMFYRFDFAIWGGDGVLSYYLLEASNYTDNRKINASNIEGGKGLFFAVSHDHLIDLQPTGPFYDSLSLNDAVRHLKFYHLPYGGVYTDPDTTQVNPFF